MARSPGPKAAPIGSILRAAQVLKSFGPGEVLRFRDVVERTGLPRAAAHRILHSLAAAGLLEPAQPRGFESRVRLVAPPRYRIGYASQNESAQFPKQLTSGLQESADAHGVDLIIVDNRYDPRQVIRNTRFLIEQHVDLAIEFATFDDLAETVGTSFQSAHIPVISVESSIPGAVFYGANNYEAGLLAGKALGKWARMHWNLRVDGLLLIGLPGAGHLAELRMNGTLAGVREVLGDFPHNRVIHLDGRNSYEGSRKAVKAWLATARPGRYLIGAVNDPSALGALAAVSRWDQGSFVAVGQNGTQAARQNMRKSNSKLIGSVDYFPERYGESLIQLGLAMLQNRTVPLANFIQHRLVTPDNVDRLYPEDRFLQ